MYVASQSVSVRSCFSGRNGSPLGSVFALHKKGHHLLAGGGIFILLNSISEMIEGEVDLTAFVKRHSSSITERQFMLR